MNGRPRAGLAALKRAAGLEEKAAHRRAPGLPARPAPQRRRAAGQRAAGAGAAPDRRPEARAAAPWLQRTGGRKTASGATWNGPYSPQAEAIMLAGFDFPGHRANRARPRGLEHGRIGAGGGAPGGDTYHYPDHPPGRATDGVLKGSCRSIPGVDIFAALTAAGEPPDESTAATGRRRG